MDFQKRKTMPSQESVLLAQVAISVPRPKACFTKLYQTDGDYQDFPFS
jgi:hypothetical protein